MFTLHKTKKKKKKLKLIVWKTIGTVFEDLLLINYEDSHKSLNSPNTRGLL